MKQYLRQWIAWLIMAAGVCLLSGPFIAGAIGEYKQRNVVLQFERQLEVTGTINAPGLSPQPLMEAERPVSVQEQQDGTVEEELPEIQPKDDILPKQEQNNVQEQSGSAASSEPQKKDNDTDSTFTPVSDGTEAKGTGGSIEEPKLTEAPGVDESEQESEEEYKAEKKGESENSLTPLEQFCMAAIEYNDSLVYNYLMNMSNRSDLDYFPIRAETFGIKDSLIGTVSIPRLGVELGLYLGTTESNMAKGLAVFGQTSVPLGRPNENCSIAGHRGWNGTPVLRDIQQLMPDDPIYISTLWGKLEYRVCELRIVSPEDNSWCAIQADRTLITLMTCHPYGHNYQRYIVFAELYKPAESDGQPGQQEITARQDRYSTENISSEVSVLGKVNNWFRGLKKVITGSLQTAEQTENPVIQENHQGSEEQKLEGQEPEKQQSALQQERYPSDRQAAGLQQLPEKQAVTLVNPDGSTETIEIDTTAIMPGAEEYGTAISNLVIMAENRMKPIAIGSAIFVGIVGVVLTVETYRGIRKEKGEKHASE